MRHRNRTAQGLVRIALDLEKRANRFKESDPEAYRKCRGHELHKAAELVGQVGRDLRHLDY